MLQSARAPVWLSYPTFALAGLSAGALIGRHGVRTALAAGGDAALPWLAGAIAQNAGMWVLLPSALVLALAQLAVWRPIAGRISQDERDQHLG